MALTAEEEARYQEYWEQERIYLQRQLDNWRAQEFENIRRRRYDRVLTKQEAAEELARCEKGTSLYHMERAFYLRRLYFWTVDDIPVQCY